MTNDGWGNAWPTVITPEPKMEGINPTVAWLEEAGPVPKHVWDDLKPVTVEWPKASYAGSTQLKKQGSNLVDDEGHLYFQCEGCEALFDPATKSFKTLHDYAHKQGWKIKWNTNGLGYKIYCVKCGD